jgi:hypothetical protein
MTPKLQELLDQQNDDGGWSYRRGGGSWTEPTCYALSALLAGGLPSSGEPVAKGVQSLSVLQNSDGGFAPRRGVAESTWVTALVLLLPPDLLPPESRARAASWLLEQTGRESSLWFRLRMRLLQNELAQGQEFDGWPWYPGAAAWVGPTALSILALKKLRAQSASAGGQGRQQEIDQRLQQGRSYLLARRCRDGGWNHGSTRSLGYDSDSYPETTGIALLALYDVAAPELQEAVNVAQRHLQTCESLEASSWLTLALLACRSNPVPRQQPPRGGAMETALAALAEAALEGRNAFVG